MPTVVLGYTCACGELVNVFELQLGKTSHLSNNICVCCRNGHVSRFRLSDIGVLDVWGRDATDASLSKA